MWFQVKRRETNRVRNVKGKVISRRYVYYIVVRRLFRRREFLRLLPGWREKLEAEQPCSVELTRARYNATEFPEKAMAETVAYFLKHQPDNYIL